MRISKFCIVLLCVTLLTGCAQRIRADVTAMSEVGYSPHGESVRLALLPGFVPEGSTDAAESFALIEAQLLPALSALGYNTSPTDEKTPVLIHAYWFGTGPHPVYSRSYVRDPWGYRYHRRHWRRPVIIVEDVYQRFLVIEAIQQQDSTAPVALGQSVTAATDTFAKGELRKDNAKPSPARSSYAMQAAGVADGNEAKINPTADMEDWEKSLGPRDAARALPASPKRLLWRVTVMSQGSLSRPERVLSELVTAALPWLGKNADMQVVVSGGEVVGAQPAP